MFLRSSQFRENISESIKESIRKKSKNFVAINNTLFINQNGIHKTFLCKFETNIIERILKEKHEIDHIGGFNLFSRINENFVGITRNMCVEYVRRCFACQRAGLAVNLPYL